MLERPLHLLVQLPPEQTQRRHDESQVCRRHRSVERHVMVPQEPKLVHVYGRPVLQGVRVESHRVPHVHRHPTRVRIGVEVLHGADRHVGFPERRPCLIRPARALLIIVFRRRIVRRRIRRRFIGRRPVPEQVLGRLAFAPGPVRDQRRRHRDDRSIVVGFVGGIVGRSGLREEDVQVRGGVRGPHVAVLGKRKDEGVLSSAGVGCDPRGSIGGGAVAAERDLGIVRHELGRIAERVEDWGVGHVRVHVHGLAAFPHRGGDALDRGVPARPGHLPGPPSLVPAEHAGHEGGNEIVHHQLSAEVHEPVAHRGLTLALLAAPRWWCDVRHGGTVASTDRRSRPRTLDARWFWG
mmetsp:Transcript_7141/g.32655  ORF Transcript_7141/g.32655 Transcript_7141/m.32655 type:complete len:351 (-) Transcript_7141:24-1076(-)